jgi:hypothetical protein
VKRFTPLTDDELRGLGLDDDERLAAKARTNEQLAVYWITFLYAHGHGEKAARLLGAVGNWPRMLRLVANKLEGKRRKTDLTPTGENVLKAYWGTRLLENNDEPPTLAEVRAFWKQLFGKTPRPRDGTIRDTLTRRKLPLRPDRRRRPRKIR